MIYTFYSYKGGVGRTHLLANLASYLCFYRKRRILLIDWDLEAPSLHFYFKTDGKTPETREGLLDLFAKYLENLQQGNLTEDTLPAPKPYICNMRSAKNGGKIDLMPAIAYTENYHQHINAFDWIDFFQNQDGKAYLLWLKEELRKGYDYVFIDSRTGVTDYSGICNVLMPDVNVLVMAPNEANFEGCEQMAHRIMNAPYANEAGKQRPILPILSRMDDVLGEVGEEWKSDFIRRFAFTMPTLQPDVAPFEEEALDVLLGETILKYNSDFSVGEKTRFHEDATPLKKAHFMKHFENIAEGILERIFEGKGIAFSLEEVLDKNNWFVLGTVYSETNYKKSLKAYQKALEILPTGFGIYHQIGVLNVEWGEYDEALKVYNEILEKDPKDSAVIYEIGYLKYLMNKYEEAESYYDKAFEMEKPDFIRDILNCRIFYGKSMIYSIRNNKEKTLEYLQKAIEINFIGQRKYQDKNALANKAFDWLREDADFIALVGKAGETTESEQ